ncbi:MAG: hypothetical protein HS111_24400 [Kofleriaceae bacterium]|nr:hypothetical protein [Kofleriaceae bacterium]MCL4228827.1 hypothetical protein [Myxococcales bacterium]
MLARLAVAASVIAAPRAAAAGVSVFRLSEVVTAGPTGDPAARYVELEASGDGCLFPSTVVRAYGPDGATLGDAMPFASTTCFAAGTFLLFATPAAQAAFQTAADAALVPALPAAAGQLCLVSSTTRYDCVRWGAITQPVHDLFAPADDTHALAPPGGLALARVADVNVVEVDWRIETPTPRAPNDGQPWDPGDAGVDAAPPDAGDAGLDAAPPIDAPFTVDAARVDANDRFLDLDPRGGATCGCGAGAPGTSLGLALVVLATLGRRRRDATPRVRPGARDERRR